MKLEIPDGDFSAYLFDCDGTIADSMALHYLAWKKASRNGIATLKKNFLCLGRLAGSGDYLCPE
jgi:beta-phosphoglucomutase-like phosphatase (HAD superfamily)